MMNAIEAIACMVGIGATFLLILWLPGWIVSRIHDDHRRNR